MDNKPKKKRGRPAGSNSFINVQVDELNRLLQGLAYVPVSTKFAREQGLVGKVGTAADIHRGAAVVPAAPIVAQNIDLTGIPDPFAEQDVAPIEHEDI